MESRFTIFTKRPTIRLICGIHTGMTDGFGAMAAARAPVTVEMNLDASQRSLPFYCDVNVSNTSLVRHWCTNVAHSRMDKLPFNGNVCVARYRNIQRLHRYSIVDTGRAIARISNDIRRFL